MESLIKLVIALIVVGLIVLGESCGAFVSESTAVNALSNQGFSDIKITNKSIYFITWGGCAESDAAKFDATAKNPLGKEVKLFVCVGWPSKGATIRSY